MALSRISDLTTGTVPIIGTALFEVSVPNAGAPSGYDSRKFTLTNLLSTAVAKSGDTMTGGLLVNGTITQGVTNPNASFQGIASIGSAYNEIAVYGAGAGTGANYCAISADATTAWLYSNINLPLHIESDGASGGIYFDTGATTTNRMSITANGNVNLYAPLAVYKADGSTLLSIYDDGNSHVMSNTQLWLNATGLPTIVGGALTTHVVTSSIAGQTTANLNTNGVANLYLDDTLNGAANGGSIIFSASNSAWKFAAIKASATDGAGNSRGNLYISTRRTASATTLTPTALFTDDGTCFNTSGVWAVFSDRSLKQDVEPYERGLDAIVRLSPVQFRYQPGTLFTTEDAPSRVLYGLIADEVLPHIPEICSSMNLPLDDDIDGEKRTIATLNPTDLIYCLINAVKELHAEIESIKSSLN